MGMNLTLGSASFALALLAAASMGLALQRGATCTVAAMEEIVHERRGMRLLALLEAALWVAAGLLLAHALGLQPALPAAPVLSVWTLVGAVLLGLGALVNGACVFGAVARLGAGHWAYLATPPGFFVGCLAVPDGWVPRPALVMPAGAPAALQVPAWALWLLVVALLLRLGMGVAGRRRRGVWRTAWSPHAATAAIGVAFVALLLLAGAWAYTDVLAELARQMVHGMATGLVPRIALAVALLAGALYGGWATGQWQRQVPTAAAIVRCFAGGVLLGTGSVLVPGGNDSLILIGLPLLWPHAWAAFAVMCAVIGAALAARARWQRRVGVSASRGVTAHHES